MPVVGALTTRGAGEKMSCSGLEPLVSVRGSAPGLSPSEELSFGVDLKMLLDERPLLLGCGTTLMTLDDPDELLGAACPALSGPGPESVPIWLCTGSVRRCGRNCAV